MSTGQGMGASLCTKQMELIYTHQYTCLQNRVWVLLGVRKNGAYIDTLLYMSTGQGADGPQRRKKLSVYRQFTVKV
jgi:hypothetical protein